jgi:hypothetical protein
MLRPSSEDIPRYAQTDQTLEKYSTTRQLVTPKANPGPNKIGGDYVFFEIFWPC